MKRIKLLIEYDGTQYVGWQSQQNGRSIQSEIEESLRELFNQPIKIYVAGRTDAGVHALGQVAHFDINNISIDHKKIFHAINFFLKKRKNKITILDSDIVDKSFHARFSVKKKFYLYRILNRTTQSFLLENRSWFIPQKIDLELMQKASKFLIGNHDFSAFRSVDCQSRVSVRTIDEIEIKRSTHFIDVRICAKAFMHNQVRIMVGTLVNVGKRIFQYTDIPKILNSKKRKNAGPTAPSEGLYLEKIIY